MHNVIIENRPVKELCLGFYNDRPIGPNITLSEYENMRKMWGKEKLQFNGNLELWIYKMEEGSSAKCGYGKNPQRIMITIPKMLLL